MVVSLFAAFSCVGCVSSEMATDITRPVVQPGPIQYIAPSSPLKIVNQQIARELNANSQRSFDPSNWAVGDGLLRYKSSLDLSPESLKKASRETYKGEWEFNAPLDKAGFNLDLSVTPHARIEKVAGHESRSAGAEVRLGQIADRLDQRGEKVKVDSWYMFVGTDNEALCWDVGDKGAKFDGVALRDQVTVGDWQAGVAFHKAGGELSVGVMRRETRFEQFKTVNDIAAVSFTMRR